MTLPDTERLVFSKLSNHDQSMALFDMLRVVRGDAAAIKRAVIEMQTDILQSRQSQRDQPQNTEQKIETALNNRFNFGKYLLDRVAPNVITVIVLGLLYLVFSK